jgi:hypothetical protein
MVRVINEHFEPEVNAAGPGAIIFQRPQKAENRIWSTIMSFIPILYTADLLSYHNRVQHLLLSISSLQETIMSGHIFYRERQKVKDGSKTPRFRITAVSGVDLKVYADHFRLGELKQLADATGADLVALKGGGGKNKPDKA